MGFLQTGLSQVCTTERELETGEQRPFFLCMRVQCEDGPKGKSKSGDRVPIRAGRQSTAAAAH